MILLDIVGLAVLIGAFIYFDRRPELLEPDGTTRAMTLREWIKTDYFITEPRPTVSRRANKKAETVTSYQLQYGNDLSIANTATNKNTIKENLS